MLCYVLLERECYRTVWVPNEDLADVTGGKSQTDDGTNSRSRIALSPQVGYFKRRYGFTIQIVRDNVACDD